MRDKNVFEAHVQQIRANAHKASSDAYSAMQDLTYADLSNLEEDTLSSLQEQEDNRVEGVSGNLANLGASLLSGGSRTVGSMINSLIGMGVTDLSNLPQEAIDAYNVTKNPNATPEELEKAKAFLESPIKAGENNIGLDEDWVINADTYANKIDAAVKSSEVTNKVKDFFDISSIVKQGNRDELNQALDEVINKELPQFEEGKKKIKQGDIWDGVTDMADAASSIIFKGAGEGITNPMAVAEYVVENLPSMAGKTIATASNVGYGAEVLNEAIAQYSKENNGQLPSKERLEEMKLWAASVVGAEQAGDMFILGKGKAAKTVAGKAVKATGKAAGTFASEGVTEAYQTAVEESLIHDKEVDTAETFKAGIIGGLAGTGTKAALSTPKAVKETAKVTGKAASKVTEAASGVTNTVIDKVVSKGESKRSLADRKNEDQIIEDAVVTKDESKLDSLMKEASKTTRGAVEVSKKIAKSDVSIEAKQAASEQVNQSISKEMDLLASLEAEAGKTKTFDKSLNTKIQKQAERVEDLNVQAGSIRQAATLDKDNIDSLMTELGKAGSGSSVKAAKRIFGSFRANPESVTNEQLTTLEKSGHLSNEAVQHIQAYRSIKESIDQSMDEVEQQVLVGGTQKGTNRYMFGLKNYADMVLNGNKAAGLKGLRSFTERHIAKANEMEAAFGKVKSGETAEVTLSDGSWIRANSSKLVAQTRKEADLLRQAYNKLKDVPEVIPEFSSKYSPQASNVDDIETKGNEDVQVPEKAVKKVVRKETSKQTKTSSKQADVKEPSKKTTQKVEEVDPIDFFMKQDLAKQTKLIKDSYGVELKTEDEVADFIVEKLFPSEEATTEISRKKMPRKTGEPVDVSYDLELAKKDLTKLFSPKAKERLSSKQKDNRVKAIIKYIQSLNDYKQGKGSLPKGAGKVRPVEKYSLGKSLTNKVVDTTKFIGEQNLIAKYFKPSNKQTLLTTNDNLMESLQNDPVSVLGEDVSEATLAVNNVFHRFYAALDKQLEVLVEPNTKQDKNGNIHNQYDYVQSLLDENGKLPSNVKAAMVAASWDWLVANGKDSTFAGESDVRSLLGLKDDDYVAGRVYKLFDNHAATPTRIANNIGKGAYRALGLSTKPEALEYSQALLENALGGYMVEAMIESGFLSQPKNISYKDIINAYPQGSVPSVVMDKKGVNKKGQDTYPDLQVISANESKFNKIIEINKLDNKFVSNVFGSTFEKPLSFDSAPEVLETKAKTTQKVAKEFKEIIKKVQAQPAKMNLGTVDALRKIGYDRAKVALGWKDTTNVIDSLVPAVKSKNREIEKALDTIFEQADHSGDKPFFYQWNQWSNDRWGITNRFNPQASKLIRYTQHYADWEAELDMGNSEQMNWFLLAVGQAFDIIPDKSYDNSALKKVYKLLRSDEFKTALEANKRIKQTDTPTDEDLQILADLMNEHEGMATLNAMDAYTDYALARERGETKFTQSLAREIDGITNGVWITSTQLASSDIEAEMVKQRRMGLNDDTKTFADRNERDNIQDSYRTLAANWTKSIVDRLKTDPKLMGQYRALSYIIGNLADVETQEVGDDGRTMAKGPLMQSIYSASIQTIIGSLANDGESKILKSMQKAYEGYLKTNDEQAALQTVNKQLRAFYTAIGSEPKYLTSIKEVKLFKFDNKDLIKFANVVANVYELPLDIAMDNEYGDLFDSRKDINSAANLAGLLSSAMYEKRKAELVRRKGDKHVSEQALTIAERKQLDEEMKRVMPYFYSPSAIFHTDGSEQAMLDSAISLVGKEDSMIEGTVGRIELKFGGDRTNKTKTRTLQALGKVMDSVGAKTVPIGTQSTDAYIQSLEMLHADAGFNVHDATYLGANDWDGQSYYNQAAYEALVNYDFPKEIHRMFDRILTEASKDIELLTEVLNSPEGKKHLKQIAGESNSFEKDGKLIRYKKLADGTDVIDAVKWGNVNLEKLAEEHRKNKLVILKERGVSLQQYNNGDGAPYYLPYASIEMTPVQAAEAAVEQIIEESTIPVEQPTESQIKDFNSYKSANGAKIKDSDLELVAQYDTSTLEGINNALNDLHTKAGARKHLKALGRTILKGSSESYRDMESFDYDSVETVTKETIGEVFNFMVQQSPNESVAHLNQLSSVINDVASQVIEPFNLHYGTDEDGRTIGATDGTEMYIINSATGMNTPSRTLDSNMSAAEVMAHEVVHNISQIGLEQDVFARNQVNKLWKMAKANKKLFNPEMFLPEGVSENDSNYAEELEIAKNKYKHIFDIRVDTVINGKAVSNHLHEFLAFGQTNEKFRNALKQLGYTTSKRNEGTDVLSRLGNAFAHVMDYIYTNWIGSNKRNAQRQLDELFKTLSNVDNANKAKMRRMKNRFSQPFVKQKDKFVRVNKPVINKASQLTDKITEPTRSTAKTLWNELYIRSYNHQNVFIRGLGKVMTEASGRIDSNKAQHALRLKANKDVDAERESTRVTIQKVLTEKFKRDITPELDNALFMGLGRADAATLRTIIGEENLTKALTDRAYRNQLINDYRTQLRTFANGNFYVEQSENLGKYMATGRNEHAQGLLNVRAISEVSSKNVKRVTNARAAVPAIEALASLTALNNLPSETLANLKELVENESEGVNFALDLMEQYQTKAKEDFSENPYSLIKGYMREMGNPDIDVRTGSLADEKELNRQGYIRKEALPKDPSDQNQVTQYIYVNPYGGKAAFLQGNFYMKTDAAKGTKLDLDKDIDEDAFNQANILKSNIGLVRGSHQAVPKLDSKGKIIGYRYMMTDASKKHYMGITNSFISSFAMMSADLATKKTMKDNNKNVINAIYDQYLEQYSTNPEMFVKISPNHPDAKIREIYAMLPRDAREYAAQAFRGLPMVRKDQLDLLFGYRKYSVRETLAKDPILRNQFTNTMVKMLTTVLGGHPTMWKVVVSAENIVQELIKWTKDVIVIRSAVVTIGNTLSNMNQLWLRGVPMKAIMLGHAQAFEAFRNYKRTDKEVREVAVKLGSKRLSNAERTKLEKRLIQLQTELVGNPANPLIEAGILPNIVEDTSERIEDFSFKAKGIDKLKSFKVVNKALNKAETNRHFKPAINGIKNLTAMQGSTVHNVLSDAAMFSDFGARFVLYHYLAKDVKSEADKANIMGQVMDEFINYDLPTTRAMQYLNDIGILWFTKYLIRVQKTIAKMFLERPASMILKLMALDMLAPSLPNVVDSNLMDKGVMGNVNLPTDPIMDAPSTIYSSQIVKTLF